MYVGLRQYLQAAGNHPRYRMLHVLTRICISTSMLELICCAHYLLIYVFSRSRLTGFLASQHWQVDVLVADTNIEFEGA